MILRTVMTFDDLMNLAKEDVNLHRKLDNYSIYIPCAANTNEDRRLSDLCYLEESPTVTDDNEEFFSDFVTGNDLEIYSLGQHLTETIHNAWMQKETATNAELLEALEWYLRNDSFIDFHADQSLISFYASILPNISVNEAESFIADFGASRLKGYKLLSSRYGTMLFSDHERCDVSTLSGSFAITHHSYALKIQISGDCWSHLLYGEHRLLSPAECIVSGQERKKKPKTKVMPIPQAVQNVFPHTDANRIKNYICSDKDETTLIVRDGKFYVRAEDKYSVDDPRQAFDFIRYLGFDISM